MCHGMVQYGVMADVRIERGDQVLARTAFDEQVTRRALSGPIMGSDFVVVPVCTEEEWRAAEDEDRDPRPTPWPAEDVELLVSEAEARIESRLAELDDAQAEGRLRELGERIPPIAEQIHPSRR
jgi:hypothetical protein